MAQAKAKLQVKLTGADYMKLTPPSHRGVRYQLIEGELVKMAGASRAHQVFIGELYIEVRVQTRALGLGETYLPPFDVYLDEHNTFQPDLMFVSSEQRHIIGDRGVTGAPDVVVEVLSESTRQRDLNVKLPVYVRNAVREAWIADLRLETVSKYVGDGHTMTLARMYDASDTLTSEAMPGVAIDLGPIFAQIRGSALPDD
ncbi:MAG: Uma2 family endonuclease [Chloroflexota bacterium]|nr:Uma2 family endonuclease [Chloroflexota bacterium]MDE2958515.1 Uma2 family endonuclease [Chloroflexota bacterium]